MSLQQADVSHYPEVPSSPRMNREARGQTSRWLDRFSTLLDDTEMSAELCRERLRSVPDLRAEGEKALRALTRHACQADLSLLDELRQAVEDLDEREQELRHRLALLAPGDQEAGVDLLAGREPSAAAAQRSSILDYAAVLQMTTSPSNTRAAMLMGLFSLTWLLVTSVSALLLLEGFMHALGFLALGFLALYALIFGVGAIWATSAIRAATDEQLTLSGRDLVIRRKLGPIVRNRMHSVEPATRAHVCWAKEKDAHGAPRALHAALRDASGAEVTFGAGSSPDELETMIERLNSYFQALR